MSILFKHLRLLESKVNLLIILNTVVNVIGINTTDASTLCLTNIWWRLLSPHEDNKNNTMCYVLKGLPGNQYCCKQNVLKWIFYEGQ